MTHYLAAFLEAFPVEIMGHLKGNLKIGCQNQKKNIFLQKNLEIQAIFL